jgi:methylenetetrahydrofolate dehydrogenase (NADP+)/methenyltetrahydrofolate cyclohydrolase
MIINGREIAGEIREATKAIALRLTRPPSFLAVAVAPSPATVSYLKMKREQAAQVGIHMEVRTYVEATTKELVEMLGQVTEDAVIIQLPLPSEVDTHAVLDAIPPGKDADVLATHTREERVLMHPVAAAVREVLVRGAIEPKAKRVTVVGNGWLVGSPAAAWLRSVGADVTVVTREEGNVKEALLAADIIVTGAGVAGLIGKADIKPGAAVIDIGTSELGGTVAGDASPDVAEVAGLFTPVPGGVGPITVAFLLRNVALLAERVSQ